MANNRGCVELPKSVVWGDLIISGLSYSLGKAPIYHICASYLFSASYSKWEIAHGPALAAANDEQRGRSFRLRKGNPLGGPYMISASTAWHARLY